MNTRHRSRILGQDNRCAATGVTAFVALYLTTTAVAGPPVKLNGPLIAGGRVTSDASRFSPDGSRVFYLASQDAVGLTELFSVPSGGGVAVKLNVQLGSGVQAFYVGPDGENVYYQTPPNFSGAGEDGIFAVPSTGGASVRLVGPLSATERLSPLNGRSNAKLSPDGTHIVYAIDNLPGRLGPVTQQLFSVPTEGGEPTLLASQNFDGARAVQQTISPDSSRVVFTWSGSIYSVPLAGGDLELLDDHFGSVFAPLISPDGRRVVYQGDRETPGLFEVYSVATTGGMPVKLNGPLAPNVSGSRRDVFKAWFSGDGSRVVYRADQDTFGRYEIYSVPSEGGTSIKLNGPLLSGSLPEPGFNAVQTLVLYPAQQEALGVTDLYVVPISGGTPQKVNGPPGDAGGVHTGMFTPDSTRVIYRGRANATGPFELYSVGSSGIPVKLNGQLVAGGEVIWGYWGTVDVSPDGHRVIYQADQESDDFPEQYIVPTAGGSPVKISAGLEIYSCKYSPDGSRVLFETASRAGVPSEIYTRLVREQWHAAAGSWDSAANWNYGETPDEAMEVVIAGGGSVTASGNVAQRKVNELQIGGGTGTATLTLQSDAEITAVNGVILKSNGVLVGNGAIDGSVFNSGVVSPDLSAGTLQIEDDYSQDSNGRLHIDLASPSNFGQLLVFGDATLHGVLDLSLIDYFPSAGETFDIVTATDGLNGRFAEVRYSPLPGGHRFDVRYMPNSVRLTVVAVPEPSALALAALAPLAWRRGRRSETHPNPITEP